MSLSDDKENNNIESLGNKFNETTSIESTSTLSLSGNFDVSKKVNAYLRKSLSGKQEDKKYSPIFNELDNDSEERKLTQEEKISREQALLKELAHLKKISETISLKNNYDACNDNADNHASIHSHDKKNNDQKIKNDTITSNETANNSKNLSNNQLNFQPKDTTKQSENTNISASNTNYYNSHNTEENKNKYREKNKTITNREINHRSPFINNKNNTTNKNDKFNNNKSSLASHNKNYNNFKKNESNNRKQIQEDDFKKREDELRSAILEVRKNIVHTTPPPTKQPITAGLSGYTKPTGTPNIGFKDLMLLNEKNNIAPKVEDKIKKKKTVEYTPTVFEEETVANNIKINKNKSLSKNDRHHNKKHLYNDISQDNNYNNYNNNNNYNNSSINSNRFFKAKNKRNSKKYSVKDFVQMDISISGPMTVRELSIITSQSINDVTLLLKKLDVNVTTPNQYLHPDIIELIVLELGHKIAESNDKKLESELSKIDESNLKERPPIVSIMGHVDHGKTTLLDVFRKSNIVDKESGGITQHIGAYQVELNDSDGDLKKVTFIDTPGHEAFFSIRSRGSKFTDIVILVVAADDGVKAQTIEIINHVKHSGVAVIVAVNKIDAQGADINKIAGELLTHDITVEDMGGDIMMIPISAKNKTNISQLGEAILLQSQMMELKADYDTKAKGMVIESSVDKKIGIIVTLLIMHGSLKVGDTVVSGNNYGKIKRMSSAEGAIIKNADPSYPVEIIGFSELPKVGESFVVVKNEKEAKSLIIEREDRDDIKNFNNEKKVTVDVNTFFGSKESLFVTEEDNKLSLNVLLKADNNGSLEAMIYAIEAIPQNDIDLNIVAKGLSVISESDAIFAKDCNAIIVAFGVKTDKVAQSIIEKNKITVYSNDIIYKLIEFIEKEALSKLDPTKKEDIIGRLEVRALYNVTKGSLIFGGLVLSGKITHNNSIRVLAKNTNEIKSDNGKVKALKRFKDDVKEVVNGYECGMAIEGISNIEIGDIIECYNITEELRSNLS